MGKNNNTRKLNKKNTSKGKKPKRNYTRKQKGGIRLEDGWYVNMNKDLKTPPIFKLTNTIDSNGDARKNQQSELFKENTKYKLEQILPEDIIYNKEEIAKKGLNNTLKKWLRTNIFMRRHGEKTGRKQRMKMKSEIITRIINFYEPKKSSGNLNTDCIEKRFMEYLKNLKESVNEKLIPKAEYDVINKARNFENEFHAMITSWKPISLRKWGCSPGTNTLRQNDINNWKQTTTKGSPLKRLNEIFQTKFDNKDKSASNKGKSASNKGKSASNNDKLFEEHKKNLRTQLENSFNSSLNGENYKNIINNIKKAKTGGEVQKAYEVFKPNKETFMKMMIKLLSHEKVYPDTAGKPIPLPLQKKLKSELIGEFKKKVDEKIKKLNEKKKEKIQEINNKFCDKREYDIENKIKAMKNTSLDNFDEETLQKNYDDIQGKIDPNCYDNKETTGKKKSMEVAEIYKATLARITKEKEESKKKAEEEKKQKAEQARLEIERKRLEEENKKKAEEEARLAEIKRIENERLAKEAADKKAKCDDPIEKKIKKITDEIGNKDTINNYSNNQIITNYINEIKPLLEECKDTSMAKELKKIQKLLQERSDKIEKQQKECIKDWEQLDRKQKIPEINQEPLQKIKEYFKELNNIINTDNGGNCNKNVNPTEYEAILTKINLVKRVITKKEDFDKATEKNNTLQKNADARATQLEEAKKREEEAKRKEEEDAKRLEDEQKAQEEAKKREEEEAKRKEEEEAEAKRKEEEEAEALEPEKLAEMSDYELMTIMNNSGNIDKVNEIIAILDKRRQQKKARDEPAIPQRDNGFSFTRILTDQTAVTGEQQGQAAGHSGTFVKYTHEGKNWTGKIFFNNDLQENDIDKTNFKISKLDNITELKVNDVGVISSAPPLEQLEKEKIYTIKEYSEDATKENMIGILEKSIYDLFHNTIMDNDEIIKTFRDELMFKISKKNQSNTLIHSMGDPVLNSKLYFIMENPFESLKISEQNKNKPIRLYDCKIGQKTVFKKDKGTKSRQGGKIRDEIISDSKNSGFRLEGIMIENQKENKKKMDKLIEDFLTKDGKAKEKYKNIYKYNVPKAFKLSNKHNIFRIKPMLMFQEIFSHCKSENRTNLKAKMNEEVYKIKKFIESVKNAVAQNKNLFSFIGSSLSIVINEEDVQLNIFDFGHPWIFHNNRLLQYPTRSRKTFQAKCNQFKLIQEPKLKDKALAQYEFYKIFPNLNPSPEKKSGMLSKFKKNLPLPCIFTMYVFIMQNLYMFEMNLQYLINTPVSNNDLKTPIEKLKTTLKCLMFLYNTLPFITCDKQRHVVEKLEENPNIKKAIFKFENESEENWANFATNNNLYSNYAKVKKKLESNSKSAMADKMEYDRIEEKMKSDENTKTIVDNFLDYLKNPKPGNPVIQDPEPIDNIPSFINKLYKNLNVDYPINHPELIIIVERCINFFLKFYQFYINPTKNTKKITIPTPSLKNSNYQLKVQTYEKNEIDLWTLDINEIILKHENYNLTKKAKEIPKILKQEKESYMKIHNNYYEGLDSFCKEWEKWKIMDENRIKKINKLEVEITQMETQESEE